MLQKNVILQDIVTNLKFFSTWATPARATWGCYVTIYTEIHRSGKSLVNHMCIYLWSHTDYCDHISGFLLFL